MTVGLLGLLCLAAPLTGQSARQGMLSLDGARIFYEVIGSGDPIIVVHGGPGLDHGYLQPGLDLLATRNTVAGIQTPEPDASNRLPARRRKLAG